MNKIILSIALVLMAFTTQAQVVKLSGPRIGGTIITSGAATEFIQNSLFPGDDGWDPNGAPTAVVSQYGWQLETRFIDGDERSGLVEWVFLVGGMERGLFLPSISSLFGMRAKGGFEAALGPNLSLSGIGMVLAVGYTIQTETLNIPLNLSFVPGKSMTYEQRAEYGWDNETGVETFIPSSEIDYNTGSRISLTMGFNLAQ